MSGGGEDRFEATGAQIHYYHSNPNSAPTSGSGGDDGGGGEQAKEEHSISRGGGDTNKNDANSGVDQTAPQAAHQSNIASPSGGAGGGQSTVPITMTMITATTAVRKWMLSANSLSTTPSVDDTRVIEF